MRLRDLICNLAALAAFALTQPVAPVAQGFPAAERVPLGEAYVPTIWVDPDGCEHWVLDDGNKGYMTPHVTRQGIPVCRRGNPCGVASSDVLFASGSARLSQQGAAWLQEFFRTTRATAYIIAGHTDGRAPDAANMRLSVDRANAVAAIAARMGVRIADVRGYGERMPVAPNDTPRNRQKNRRVEIICIR